MTVSEHSVRATLRPDWTLAARLCRACGAPDLYPRCDCREYEDMEFVPHDRLQGAVDETARLRDTIQCVLDLRSSHDDRPLIVNLQAREMLARALTERQP